MVRSVVPVFLCLLVATGGRADDIRPDGMRPLQISPPAPQGALPAEPVTFELAMIPPRPAGALSGSEFADRTAGMKGVERQRAAVAEILRGNVPDFMRRLRPVRLGGEAPSGGTVEAIVWVTPDYVSIGSARDFLPMPLTQPSATAVATAFGCVLPTTRIVDAVYRQSKYRIVPDPLPPGPKMRSSEYFLRHRELIERRRAGLPAGELLAGHNKDVVLTQRLALRPDRVAIYGWHRNAGDPIQPLSTYHGARYADYSHGVRLVWGTARIDGAERSIYDVLGDPALAPALSDEGQIPSAWEIMHPSVTPLPARTPKRLARG